MLTHQVWKYILTPDEAPLQVPPGASKFLSVQAQGINLCVWIMVNPGDPVRIERKYKIIGTDQDISLFGPESMWDYAGTAQMGSLVWHVFEEYR